MNSAAYFMQPFCYNFAWVDLLLCATHKSRVIDKRGNKVKIPAGSVAISQEGLAERWQWSRGKVDRFLKYLEKSKMIVQQKSRLITTISICNWDKYQSGDTTDSATDGTTIKNVKNDYNQTLSIIEERQNCFLTEVARYKEKYPEEMLQAFFLYWGEPTPDNKKLRFELEKTWSLAGRLATWSLNEKKYKRYASKRNGNDLAESFERIDRLTDAIWGAEGN